MSVVSSCPCLMLSHVVSGHGNVFALLCFNSLRFVSIPLPPPLITPLQPCVCTHAYQIKCTGMYSSAPYTITHSTFCVRSSKLSNLTIHLLVDGPVRRFGYAFLAGDLVNACRACVSIFESCGSGRCEGEEAEVAVQRGERNRARKRK